MAIITKAAAAMHSPAHPGAILRELYLKPLGVSISGAAEALGHVSKRKETGLITMVQMQPFLRIGTSN
jgi:plasmid maintenance system antidote protein VapI